MHTKILWVSSRVIKHFHLLMVACALKRINRATPEQRGNPAEAFMTTLTLVKPVFPGYYQKLRTSNSFEDFFFCFIRMTLVM